jgi:hypothetical protein
MQGRWRAPVLAFAILVMYGGAISCLIEAWLETENVGLWSIGVAVGFVVMGVYVSGGRRIGFVRRFNARSTAEAQRGRMYWPWGAVAVSVALYLLMSAGGSISTVVLAAAGVVVGVGTTAALVQRSRSRAEHSPR